MSEKKRKTREEAIVEFDEKLEKLCEKFIKKTNVLPIDIIGRLEFWKTEYMAELFYEHSDILDLKKDIERIDKKLQQLEKRM
jgi:hypothetical protein